MLFASPENGVVCDSEDSTLCSVPLSTGAEAPFDGILVTNDLLAELSVGADSIEREVEREKKLWTQKLRIETDLRLELLKVKDDFHEESLALQKARYEEALAAVRPKWYERPAFVAATTTVVIIGTVVLSVKIIEATGE